MSAPGNERLTADSSEAAASPTCFFPTSTSLSPPATITRSAVALAKSSSVSRR